MQLICLRSNVKPLYYAPFLCMTAHMKHPVKPSYFDTDSYIIRIDNCATTSISSHIEDFVDPPIPLNKAVRGLNGTVDGAMIGTIKWHIDITTIPYQNGRQV